MKQLLNHRIVWMVALWAMFISMPLPVFALPSGSVTTLGEERNSRIAEIVETLSRPELVPHLKVAGLDISTLQQRLEKLDDATLQKVAEKADTIRAAGDAGLGILIGLLVLIILIIVIVMLLDKEVVVKDK